MLTYSGSGEFKGRGSHSKVRKAVRMLHEKHPGLKADGAMQANFALNGELRYKNYPFNKLKGQDANILIFPNMSSGNITFRMLQAMGTAEALGPVLMGLKKPVPVLRNDSSVHEIRNMTAIAVVDAESEKS